MWNAFVHYNSISVSPLVADTFTRLLHNYIWKKKKAAYPVKCEDRHFTHMWKIHAWPHDLNKKGGLCPPNLASVPNLYLARKTGGNVQSIDIIIRHLRCFTIYFI
jgi:hypothetical protein